MNSLQPLPFDPETATVGDIVAENYHSADVFKEFGLDFCCGGSNTLAVACEKQKVDSRVVAERLAALPWGKTSSSENFKAWEPDFLVDYIENTHHQFVRTKAPEISGYAARVAKVHGSHFPENIEIYKQFMGLAEELLTHLDAEEKVLFPLIRKINDLRKSGKSVNEELIAELSKELDLMETDHDEAGKIMAKIRELSHAFQPPEGACATYRILYQNLEGFEEDLHKHVHLENNILFKKAQALI